MPTQSLDLFKLAASRSAQLGAGSVRIVRRDARNANFCGILPKHLPDDFLAQAVAGNGVRTIQRAKDLTCDH